MHKNQDPAAWWKKLHPWQKMAVVLYYPNHRPAVIAQLLGLKSTTAIHTVRARILEYRYEGKKLPDPCPPDNVGMMPVPPDVPVFKTEEKYHHKPVADEKSASVKSVKPLKPTKCCFAGCADMAVPHLPFCAPHAKEVYKPMTPQIERLIAAVT